MIKTRAENRKTIGELVDYLHKIHKSGKICVFINYSGHVDWMTVSLALSKERYGSELGRFTISFHTGIGVAGISDQVVDAFQKIKDILKRKDSLVRKAEKEEAAEEKAEFERLKKKYGFKKDLKEGKR